MSHRPAGVVETPSGYYLMQVGSRDWLQDIPTTARCLFCPGFTFQGTAAEATEAGRRHRAEVHPKLVGMTQFQRNRLAKKLRSRPDMVNEE